MKKTKKRTKVSKPNLLLTDYSETEETQNNNKSHISDGNNSDKDQIACMFVVVFAKNTEERRVPCVCVPSDNGLEQDFFVKNLCKSKVNFILYIYIHVLKKCVDERILNSVKS